MKEEKNNPLEEILECIKSIDSSLTIETSQLVLSDDLKNLICSILGKKEEELIPFSVENTLERIIVRKSQGFQKRTLLVTRHMAEIFIQSFVDIYCQKMKPKI